MDPKETLEDPMDPKETLEDTQTTLEWTTRVLLDTFQWMISETMDPRGTLGDLMDPKETLEDPMDPLQETLEDPMDPDLKETLEDPTVPLQGTLVDPMDIKETSMDLKGTLEDPMDPKETSGVPLTSITLCNTLGFKALQDLDERTHLIIPRGSKDRLMDHSIIIQILECLHLES